MCGNKSMINDHNLAYVILINTEESLTEGWKPVSLPIISSPRSLEQIRCHIALELSLIPSVSHSLGRLFISPPSLFRVWIQDGTRLIKTLSLAKIRLHS